ELREALHLHLAQAARAVDRELRVPAVVRHVDAVHQQARVVECLQERAALGDLDRIAVDGDARHQSSKLPGNGQRFSCTCISKSRRKWRSRPWIGHAAASANAQIVWPSILAATSSRIARSSWVPAPRSIRFTILFIQPVPSRHCGHCPHDSSRKKYVITVATRTMQVVAFITM